MFGSSDGLTVSLKILEKDLDFLCGGSVDGFKVWLQVPFPLGGVLNFLYF